MAAALSAVPAQAGHQPQAGSTWLCCDRELADAGQQTRVGFERGNAGL